MERCLSLFYGGWIGRNRTGSFETREAAEVGEGRLHQGATVVREGKVWVGQTARRPSEAALGLAGCRGDEGEIQDKTFWLGESGVGGPL